MNIETEIAVLTEFDALDRVSRRPRDGDHHFQGILPVKDVLEHQPDPCARIGEGGVFPVNLTGRMP